MTAFGLRSPCVPDRMNQRSQRVSPNVRAFLNHREQRTVQLIGQLRPGPLSPDTLNQTDFPHSHPHGREEFKSPGVPYVGGLIAPSKSRRLAVAPAFFVAKPRHGTGNGTARARSDQQLIELVTPRHLAFLPDMATYDGVALTPALG
jgi:hypothetical protein